MNKYLKILNGIYDFIELKFNPSGNENFNKYETFTKMLCANELEYKIDSEDEDTISDEEQEMLIDIAYDYYMYIEDDMPISKIVSAVYDASEEYNSVLEFYTAFSEGYETLRMIDKYLY